MELFLYSGTVWGFSFLEFIFKQEMILYDEFCQNNETEELEPVLCEDALEFYNLIFTLTLISAVCTSGSLLV